MMELNGKKVHTFEDTWNDPDGLTQAEKDKIELEVKLVGKLIEARHKKGLSQEKLAELSGLKQPAIARLERLDATPQIDTMQKVLRPLGYKLDIVPLR